MAPTDISEPPGPILSSRARRHLLVLPEEPTDEDLVQHWTLSEADTREVLRCRGEDNRRRFALQLCALRTYGRFVPNQAVVPVRILNYLGASSIYLRPDPAATAPGSHRFGPWKHGFGLISRSTPSMPQHASAWCSG